MDCRLRHREIFFRAAIFIVGIGADRTPPRTSPASFRFNGQDYVPLEVGRARTVCIAPGSGAVTKWSPRTARPGWFLTWIRVTRKSTASRSRCRFPSRTRRAWRSSRNSISTRPSGRCCFLAVCQTGPIRTICLDPGHGGKDTGNRVGWHYEKIYTLALAAELRDQLRKAGFNVILTRTRDTYVELPDRPALANRRGADLFVSLHFNATPTGKNEVEGPQTYCITPVGASSTDAQGEGSNHGPTPANRDEDESLLLAYQIQKSLVGNLDADDRGVRRARFAVLRDARMPAILIEGGYMTHPFESRKIYSAAYRRQMAQAIVKGILAYQKMTSPPPPPLHAGINRHSGKVRQQVSRKTSIAGENNSHV